MKTMLLAAAAALSVGVGSAYADSVGGTLPNTWFNQLPGVAEKAPVQHAPAAATTQDGAHAYVTQSSHGTWLFPPYQGGGTNG